MDRQERSYFDASYGISDYLTYGLAISGIATVSCEGKIMWPEAAWERERMLDIVTRMDCFGEIMKL